MSAVLTWQTFPELALSGIRHAFSLRSSLPIETLDAALRPSVAGLGLPLGRLVDAEQTHGQGVGLVTEAEAGRRIPGVDALITQRAGLPLVIRVADCGPVYFYDPVQRAIGLAHSGRKGTALEITRHTLEHMHQAFGSRPEDVHVFLGPCIRPPHYEIDFASAIGTQARTAGVVHYHDCGLCTATHLSRYYSHRAEQRKTGRMWALLMLEPQALPLRTINHPQPVLNI